VDYVSTSGKTLSNSGDKQSMTKVCRVEIDKIAVAFGPPT
jgi:hypothetical protein